MNFLNALLPLWNAILVHPIMHGLQFVATPLLAIVPPGVAGALAIVIFTIFLRLLLVPLSLVQIRSQRAQMAIQPEMKSIQKKFKGDREGLARAQMALYKERGINPAAGCLPLLIQMPILFGMYAAMTQLATHGPHAGHGHHQPDPVGTGELRCPTYGRALPVQPVRPRAAPRRAARDGTHQHLG